MKFNSKSFKRFNKMILIALCITIFCCTLELISYQSSSETLYDSIRQSFESRAIDSSNALYYMFKEKLVTLVLIAEDDRIKSMDWEIQRSDLLTYINTLDVSRFLIADRNGVARSTDGDFADISARDYFRNALRGIANVSGVIRSKVDGSMIIAYAVPIKDKTGNIVGVLSSSVAYQSLTDMIRNIKVGKEGYAIMVNKGGVTIAHPKKDRLLSENTIPKIAETNPDFKRISSIYRRMALGEWGSDFYGYEGIDKFIAFAPVAGTDWSLGLTIPKSEMFSKIESLRNKFIIQTLIFIFSALVLTYFLYIYLVQRKKVEDLQRNINENHRHLEEVEELDKLKTEFFANITHELRTPINVIYGALQLFEHSIKDNYSIKDITKRIKIMKQNCFRLLRIINNLIDTTKLDGGYFELDLKNGNVISVVEDITQSVADYIKDKGIGLVFDTDVEEKLMAFDHDKIERIILNLLSNATKFTGEGGTILVNIYNKEDMIEISVRDTGIGIAKDKQQLIFERFRKVNQPLTKSHEGSGIGLSLVKSLVEMHEGRIYVKSELGQGSEFIMELPVKILPEERKEECSIPPADIHKHIEKLNVEFSDIYF